MGAIPGTTRPGAAASRPSWPSWAAVSILSIPLDSALDASVYDYPANVVTVKDSWKEPTYRASLGYQATPDLYVYGTYSHGYKGGGFNDQIGGFAAFGTDLDAFAEAARATDPETADSYRGGLQVANSSTTGCASTSPPSTSSTRTCRSS